MKLLHGKLSKTFPEKRNANFVSLVTLFPNDKKKSKKQMKKFILKKTIEFYTNEGLFSVYMRINHNLKKITKTYIDPKLMLLLPSRLCKSIQD